ncbi:MAG: alpha/beta fold hydrolase [Anaerolineae bacterium]|nr:alpha/beta fold hydrolase [Anaerolineae bacterium]
MPYQTIDGVRIYYHTEGSGPAVLLLHGLGSCADDWFFQFPALSERYTVIAADLRGHGRSDKPPGPYAIARMGNDMAGVLAALATGPAHVVGLSLGGLAAQALAIGHPPQVRSLVLVNTFARLRPQGLGGWLYFLSRAAAMATGGLEAQAEVVARGVFPYPEQEELRRAAAERLRANDPAAYRATMRAVLRFDSRRDLPRVRVPALVIAGKEDTTVSLAAKQELAARIPGAQLIVMSNSGHASPLDQPEQFNQLLLAFLAHYKEG